MGQMLNPRRVVATPLPRPAPRAAVVLPKVEPPRPVVNEVTTSDDANPIRKIAFYAGLCMLFVMFGTLPEVLAYAFHVNLYILYIVGPPALLGAAFAGGIGRTFKHRAAVYFALFFLWMIIATPFSSWRGSSIQRVLDYGRFSFPLIVLAGGLATGWKEIRAIFYTLAFAGMVNLAASKLFMADANGRLTLEASGTIGNPNDLAAHLILLVPFILYIATDKKRNFVLRYALLAPIAYAIWIILGTGSRGGLIAIAVTFLFMLWRASIWRRIQVVIAAVALALIVPALMPPATLARLKSLFGEEHEEAGESKQTRSYLFRKSVVYTLEHPIFGVGPDQFGNYEGKMSMEIGQRGEWHATHCAFTQVSSECGIPAMIFFMMGIGTALISVNRVWRQARQGGYEDIANACYCYLAAMVGFMVAITFLANAYRFYLPAMIGLAIALCAAATRYMREHPAESANLRPLGAY
jgi:O-antigen ligase